jgi:ParB family transcriptional regulator, chromosome partitioning protein
MDTQTQPLQQNPAPEPELMQPQAQTNIPASLEPVSLTPSAPTAPSGQNFTELELSRIKPNPWQPRKIFKQEYLEELASSIKEHGILQPLVVIPQPDGNYQIIVGERRWRASQIAGLTKVPVIIRDAMEEQQKLELALIENIQRHNLDPIEEGQAYQQLIDQYKLTQDQVAKKVGKGRTTVTNMIRLLNLPLKIQRAIADGVISEGHGRAILGLMGMEKQLSMFDIVVAENMTVRQVEDRVREIMERPRQVKAQRPNEDPELQAIESELRGKLGTKVRVQKNGDAGRITIDFFSQEELAAFLEKMHKLD